MSTLHKKVVKGDFQPVPKHFSKSLAHVIGKCLVVKEDKRASAEELLKLPAFKDDFLQEQNMRLKVESSK